MASKLDYLKKYLSKGDAKQLHSQMERGEEIKIRNTSGLKRRKKRDNRTGFVVCNPERDPTRLRESQSASSDGSGGEGPIVVSYRDDSRDTRDKLWNPISQSAPTADRGDRHDSDTEVSRQRHDSDTEVSRQRHDSDSDVEGGMNGVAGPRSDETGPAVLRSESDSDFEVKRKSPCAERDSRGRKGPRGGSRWGRDEGVKAGGLSCTVLSKGEESKRTVYRDKDGHRVDTQREEELRAEEEREKAERDARFKVAKSGIVQANMKQQRADAFSEEAGKGLARYEGDESLNEHLRAKQLLDDPLIKMKRKKTKKKQVKRRCKPTYQGNIPSNRFNIRPGYRWDGLDRSNGYEKERFRLINDRKADCDDFYKMGTEDM